MIDGKQIRSPTGFGFLFQELERMDRLLRQQALYLRQYQPDWGDQFRGPFVSDKELLDLLYIALDGQFAPDAASPPGWLHIALDHPQPVVWQGAHYTLPLSDSREKLMQYDLPPLDYRRRRALWEHTLRNAVPSADTIDRLAGRYRLYGDQIVHAAALARQQAAQRGNGGGVPSFTDLSLAVRRPSDNGLGSLAQRIDARHRWAANELSLDLYRIDLSGVVSNYIGETEKNLRRIFRQAEHANVILLFDEADALFGKRSETKDAHDRYANIEVSYLLQQIEDYDGVVILTSKGKNLDEAFLRRLQFTIEFPFPDQEAREAIWRLTVPGEAPCAGDIDYELLAQRFQLSGGSIRNAWVNAAFLAADRDGTIEMGNLLWAVRREFQKLGKLVDEKQFLLDNTLPQTVLRNRQGMTL